MQPPNYLVSKKVGKRAKFPAMARASAIDDSPEAVAHRCEVVCQIAADGNQTKLAAALGISVTRWNNIQTTGALSIQVARMLTKTVPGLTLDWLYHGVDSGLPVRLAQELEVTGNALTSAGGRRG